VYVSECLTQILEIAEVEKIQKTVFTQGSVQNEKDCVFELLKLGNHPLKTLELNIG